MTLTSTELLAWFGWILVMTNFTLSLFLGIWICGQKDLLLDIRKRKEQPLTFLIFLIPLTIISIWFIEDYIIR